MRKNQAFVPLSAARPDNKHSAPSRGIACISPEAPLEHCLRPVTASCLSISPEQRRPFKNSPAHPLKLRHFYGSAEQGLAPTDQHVPSLTSSPQGKH